MSGKTRAEFEEVFPLPSKCWWSEKSNAYCWAGFSVTRHPHDELWQAWLAAKEKYEPITQQHEAEPVAWISRVKCVGPEYGKERYGKLPVQSLNPLYYEHVPLYLHPPKPAAKDVEKLLRKAFELGKQWWMQADSESYKQNKLADQTMSKFEDLLSAAREEGK